MDEQLEFFMDQDMNNLYYEDFDNINPDESISQVFGVEQSEADVTSSSVSRTSAVWEYFDRNPPHAQGYNVCKMCSHKYMLTTGVSSLRKHLNEHHQLQPPSRNQRVTIRMHPFGEKEQKEHTKYLLQWLICDLQPFTVVDNPYFRAFINHFCPRYTVPERHQVKESIIDAFNSKRTKIINELSQIEGRCSLTADMWTSINQEAFLGITIHYIDLNWHLCNFLLDIIPFNARHTGVNIAQGIRRVLGEFNISNKIIALTTDNEAAMLVCGRELAESFDDQFSSMTFAHYRCVAHVLNLGVKKGLEIISDSVNKVHQLMTKIKNSTILCNELRDMCDAKKIKYLKPILDVDTCWNSTYYMLKRFEELQPALNLLSAANNTIKDLYPKVDLVVIKVN